MEVYILCFAAFFCHATRRFESARVLKTRMVDFIFCKVYLLATAVAGNRDQRVRFWREILRTT